jgi:hypothetical protein
MDAMQGCTSDAAEQGAALVFNSCSDEIIDIDENSMSGTVGFAALSRLGWMHVLLKAVGRQLYLVGNQALDYIACRFGGSAKIRRALGPAHLKGGGDNNVNRVAWRIGHNITKVPDLL